MGSWKASDKSIQSFRIYEHSSGARVGIYYGTFGSPSIAMNEFGLELKDPSTVIERKDKKDTSGQVVGERAITRRGADHSHEGYLISWTNGADAFWIYSLSLPAALLLEERINAGVSLTGEPDTRPK
jgi:hypothetical protein